MFTYEELKDIGVLLQRVDIKGNEALAVARLQMKIKELLSRKEKAEEDVVGSTETKEETTPTN